MTWNMELGLEPQFWAGFDMHLFNNKSHEENEKSKYFNKIEIFWKLIFTWHTIGY